MWNYYSPVKIVFGPGAVKELPSVLHKAGYKKILLFSRKFHRLDKDVQKVLESIKDQTAYVVDCIRPEPNTIELNKIINTIYEQNFDVVVAIGGGSIIDSAKAVMAGYANHSRVEELMNHTTKFSHALPLIAVPTTSGTGSEVTRAAAITHNGNKQPIFDDTLYPSIAIVDPVLTRGCPPALTASCGFDVLSHAVESLMHRNSNPMSESFAKDALKLCVKFFRQAYDQPDNIEARTAMSMASMKAGLAIASSGCTAAHAFSYLLSSDYGIPHGEACAFSLDKLVRICVEHDERLDLIASEIGFKHGLAFSAWLFDLKKYMRVRNSMQELGVPCGEIGRLVHACANSPVLKNHYFPITQDVIWKIAERGSEYEND